VGREINIGHILNFQNFSVRLCCDPIFIEYIIHLMIQEDSEIVSIVIQVTLCPTTRLGASMLENGRSNKGNSEKSPSENVGDALSGAFAWPENAIVLSRLLV
jgi:hypothetical protein